MSIPPLRVCWILPFHTRYDDYNNVQASVWIRALQLFDPLEQLGVQSVVGDMESDCDLAVFLRVQDERAQKLARTFRRRGVPTVFNAVVNYFQREGNREVLDVRVPQNLVEDCIAMAAICDATIAASRFIADQAENHSERVFYIPDSVDLDHFSGGYLNQESLDRKLILGYAGVSTKAEEIDSIWPTALTSQPELLCISEKPPELSCDFEFVSWKYETFPQNLLRAHLGIAPRRIDNSYDRGHSSFKILVFLAQGIPVLASPVPSYDEVLKDGENGYFCADSKQWQSRIEQFLECPEHLHELSKHCRSSVSEFSTKRIAASHRKAFEQILGW